MRISKIHIPPHISNGTRFFLIRNLFPLCPHNKRNIIFHSIDTQKLGHRAQSEEPEKSTRAQNIPTMASHPSHVRPPDISGPRAAPALKRAGCFEPCTAVGTVASRINIPPTPIVGGGWGLPLSCCRPCYVCRCSLCFV